MGPGGPGLRDTFQLVETDVLTPTAFFDVTDAVNVAESQGAAVTQVFRLVKVTLPMEGKGPIALPVTQRPEPLLSATTDHVPFVEATDRLVL